MKYIVYETTNVINGKKYIGIHQTENIDDGYLGSGISMKNAIKKYGKENFKRIILEICDSFDELLEREKIYVNNDWVKEHNNYNLKTGGQSSGILSDESKKKISETLKEKYRTGEIFISDERKKEMSRFWKEKYKNEPRSEETIKKLSESLKKFYKENGTRIPWNKGTKGLQTSWNKDTEQSPLSEEHKIKISESLKDYYKEHEHPSKGLDPWNKGKKGVQVAWNKGIPQEKLECPHCGKSMNLINLKKWHLDNCKQKP